MIILLLLLLLLLDFEFVQIFNVFSQKKKKNHSPCKVIIDRIVVKVCRNILIKLLYYKTQTIIKIIIIIIFGVMVGLFTVSQLPIVLAEGHIFALVI